VENVGVRIKTEKFLFIIALYVNGLRNRGRRVAQSVSNIFYKLKKMQIKQIQDSAKLSLRKCKIKGRKFTAGKLKCPETGNNLIHFDEGF